MSRGRFDLSLISPLDASVDRLHKLPIESDVVSRGMLPCGVRLARVWGSSNERDEIRIITPSREVDRRISSVHSSFVTAPAMPTSWQSVRLPIKRSRDSHEVGVHTDQMEDSSASVFREAREQGIESDADEGLFNQEGERSSWPMLRTPKWVYSRQWC